VTTVLPTRTQIDAAGDIDFDRKRRPDLTITIKCRVDGFDTEICYTGSIDQLLQVTQRLRSLGATEPVSAPAPAPAPARKPSTVVYADDGTPLCGNANCSRHGKALEPSQHNGYYCKGKDSVTGNAKGYCKSTAE
jgi:hypothetical protein